MTRLRTRPRLAPCGLLGMLMLVALSEGSIRRYEPALAAIEAWDWREAHDAAQRPETREASVLCFGDSLVKLGVRPKVLAEAIGNGQRVRNLALCAGRAPASFFLLRQALASGARPEAIVVDFHDSFLAEPPTTTPRLYAEFLRPGEGLDLAWTIRAPGFAAEVALAYVLPSVRNRFEVRRAVREALAGQLLGEARRSSSLAWRANWQEHGGALVLPKVAAPVVIEPGTLAGVQPTPWHPDPTNAAFLARFFELAHHHQIPVVWVLPPLHPALSARRDEVGLTPQVSAFVAATLARFPGLTVVDGRGARYDPADFLDVAHLDRDGSARFSAALGAVLRDRPVGADALGRLVLLPDPPTDRPGGASWVDLVAR